MNTLYENETYDDFFEVTEINQHEKYKTIYFLFDDQIYSCDVHGKPTASEIEMYDLDKKIVVKGAIKKFPEFFL